MVLGGFVVPVFSVIFQLRASLGRRGNPNLSESSRDTCNNRASPDKPYGTLHIKWRTFCTLFGAVSSAAWQKPNKDALTETAASSRVPKISEKEGAYLCKKHNVLCVLLGLGIYKSSAYNKSVRMKGKRGLQRRARPTLDACLPAKYWVTSAQT